MNSYLSYHLDNFLLLNKPVDESVTKKIGTSLLELSLLYLMYAQHVSLHLSHRQCETDDVIQYNSVLH